jgi:hypothetical protein
MEAAVMEAQVMAACSLAAVYDAAAVLGGGAAAVAMVEAASWAAEEPAGVKVAGAVTATVEISSGAAEELGGVAVGKVVPLAPVTEAGAEVMGTPRGTPATDETGVQAGVSQGGREAMEGQPPCIEGLFSAREACRLSTEAQAAEMVLCSSG